MRPSLRQLECLVAVADHLNFRRAAETCSITQPALSAQIRQLELLLRVRLFERDRRHVLLTLAGEQVLEHARRALAEVDAFVDAARGLRAPLSGTLRLGVIPTVSPYVLPRALPAVRRKYPRLRLLIREERTQVLVQQARRGALDVLVLALEAELSDLETLPLYRDPFVVAVPAAHALAARKSVHERDLEAQEVLLLEDGHGTLVQMVASGIGVTLLPALAIQGEVRSQDRLRLLADLLRHNAPPPRRKQ